MREALSIVLVLFLILTLPSSAPIWFAPTRSWLGNIRSALTFTLTNKEPMAVGASIAATLYFIVCYHIGLMSREEAIYGCLFFTLACSLASLWALYSLVFAGKMEKATALRAFSLLFAIFSLFIAIAARSIADETIQLFTEFNPQEFSTAQYTLSLVFSLWLWIVATSLVLGLASIIPIGLMLLRVFSSRKADLRRENTEAATTLGLVVSSVFLISIAASAWTSDLLKSTSRYVLQTTSFFEIGPEMRKSVPTRYTWGRIVGDGDMILATDGNIFTAFCYRRRNPNCTADPSDEVTP
jgi:hypothetical protein